MGDDRVELERFQPQDEAPLLRPGYPRALRMPESYGYGSYGEEQASSPINLRAIWRVVRKRLWLIATLAVIVTTIVTIEIYRNKSTYQAAATIEIAKEGTTLVKTANFVIESDDSDSMKTTMLKLRSRPLLEDVVVKLKLDQNPKFKDVTEKKSILEALHTIANRVTSDAKIEAPAAVELPALEGRSASTRTPEERARLKEYVDVLNSYLAVEQIPDTRALIISFTHTDPVIAAAVANGTAQLFIERSFENKTEKFTKTSQWLDQTTRKLQAKVEEAEQKLADYTRENNIFSAQGNETLTSDKLSHLHDQVLRAQTDLILKQSLYEEVKQGRVGQLPQAFSDSKIAALQQKLNELATLASQLDVKYGPENPKVLEVKQQMLTIQEQINASRSSLEEQLKADYERAARDERMLREAIERAKAEAVQQNQAAIQYNILKQDVETAKSLYTEFLQKTSQADIQVAEQHSNMRVIEPAQVPGGPVGPKRLRAIMIGLFLSLVAGVGLAFFLEYLDNTIKTVEDVSRYAQLPALSVIPAISAATSRKLSSKKSKAAIPAGADKAVGGLSIPSQAQLVALESRSSAAEAYRVLRTSVLLSSAGRPPKSMLVTSGQPSEGKTTTVVNTAISLAQLGASVLIIDCDLRKPSTHKVFGVDHARGLSTYLSRDVEVDGLIQKLQIPNLSLLPCGPIPPNPAELISSEKMREMLAMLAERYDHILIDSPPLIHVTDPVILSTMVDGVILVVHGGKSTRDVVRRARQELMTVGAKIFGVVLNNVDLRREGYDDYYYYRYYSDYGQESKAGGGE